MKAEPSRCCSRRTWPWPARPTSTGRSPPRGQCRCGGSGRALAALPFAQVRAKTLAISLTDDPFGTVAATERLLGYLQSAERQHLRIAPVDISVEEIGHFAFFHDRFRERLWPIALEWLQRGGLLADRPGQIIS